MGNAQMFDTPPLAASHRLSGLELSPDRTQAVSYGGDDDTVSIPDFVTSLTEGLFAGQTALRYVKLPVGVKELPARLFEGCTSLERVRLPQKVNRVGQAVFAGCTTLDNVPLCPGMSEITSGMFRGCTKITTFVAPDGLEAIRSGAFADCTALQSVVISDTVDTVEEGAFDGCTSLKHIRVSDDNPVFYIEEDGTLRNKSDGEIVVSISALHHDEAAKQAVGLLKYENEIDSLTDDEEDSDESMEEMDNNFIGDEEGEVPKIEGEERESLRLSNGSRIYAAESVSAVKSEATSQKDQTNDNTKDTGGTGNMASIEDILSQNIFNRPSRDQEEMEMPEIHSEPQPIELAAPTQTAQKPQPVVAPLPVKSVPSAKVSPAVPDTPVKADAGELNRIAMESDILKQNVGATDASDTPLKADNGEINRIAMESDILSQNVKGANEVGAGMEELMLLSKESEILRDNTKVSNHITLTPTEKIAKVEGEEVPAAPEDHSPIISTPAETPAPADEKPDPILGRIKGAAQKYDLIETSGSQIPGLFVFAEKLSPSDDGEGKFSAHLVRAARNLAAKHSLRYIHFFYGLPFDHMEFMQLFRQFILGKNAIYACDTKTTHGLSPLARAFADSANIKLDKESMADQMRRAQEKTARSFRIILQDDYSK